MAEKRGGHPGATHALYNCASTLADNGARISAQVFVARVSRLFGKGKLIVVTDTVAPLVDINRLCNGGANLIALPKL